LAEGQRVDFTIDFRGRRHHAFFSLPAQQRSVCYMLSTPLLFSAPTTSPPTYPVVKMARSTVPTPVPPSALPAGTPQSRVSFQCSQCPVTAWQLERAWEESESLREPPLPDISHLQAVSSPRAVSPGP
jgi:hypothetical protein